MRRNALLMSALVMLTLSGCNRSDTLPNGGDGQKTSVSNPEQIGAEHSVGDDFVLSDGLVSLPDVYAALPEQTQAVRNQTYQNMNFTDDFTVHMPEQAEQIYQLKLTLKPEIEPEQCFDILDRLCDETCSYTDAEKQKNYRVWTNDLSRVSQDDYPFSHPSYFENKEDILSGKMSFVQLFIDTPQAYIAVEPNGRVHALNRGRTFRIKNADHPYIGMYFASWDFDVTADYDFPDDTVTDCYMLLDGKMSVADAAKQVVKLIAKDNFGGGSVLQPAVSQIQVLKLNDSCYGYNVFLTPSYKGVMLDVSHIQRAGFLNSSGQHTAQEYMLMPGYAFLPEHDTLDIVVGYNSGYEAERLHTYDRILPFDAAVQKASAAFSGEMSLQVSRADLRYACRYDDPNMQTGLTAYPVWKFTSQNENDGLIYEVYVNAVTGVCDYCKHALIQTER